MKRFCLKSVFFAVLFIASILLFFPMPAFSAKKISFLPGERIVTFRTKDGVKIIGSFFTPSSYLPDFGLLPYQVFYEKGVWNEIEKDFLSIGHYMNKQRVFKINITEGEFTYIENPSEYIEKLEEELRQKKKEEVEKKQKKIHKKTNNINKDVSRKNNCIDSVFLKEKETLEESAIDDVFNLYGQNQKALRILSYECKKIRKKEIILLKKIGKTCKTEGSNNKKVSFSDKKNSNIKDSCFLFLKGKGRKEKKYPAVILLHMWERNRHEWHPLIPYFQNAGFVILTIDLRGHGESIYKKGRKLKLKKFVTQNYKNMIQDAFAAYKFLLQQDIVDTKNISVVGASLGTVISIKLCEKVNKLKSDNPIKSVVLMSPSKNFFAVRVNDSIKKCVKTPFLFIMDKKDPTPEKNDIFISGHSLYQSFNGIKHALILDGVGHGTAMFKGKDVMNIIIDWTKRCVDKNKKEKRKGTQINADVKDQRGKIKRRNIATEHTESTEKKEERKK